MMNIKEVAIELDTDPRTLRKFMRSDASPIPAVGKGSRYEIARRDLRTIKSKFAKWNADRTTPAATD